jgi:hypothetical protein
VFALVIGISTFGHADDSFAKAPAGQAETSWHSPSLRSETVVAPNGAITTPAALLANDKWGIGHTKRVEQVTDGVYAMRGWGIGHSFAVEAPDGWIIIDAGDSTRAAEEMRAKLEEALGRKVKVAAILLTHWHYGDGIGAWLDDGAEVWGHEHLDRNRRASTGISVLSGTDQSRITAQFGIFHPQSGPDGTYTVWFAPSAPAAGKEGNWVQTMPGKSWSALLRLYAPLEPWFDKSWKPGDFELVNEEATT